MAGSNDNIPQISTPSLNANPGAVASGGLSGGNRELMADARASLEGNWGLAILGIILYYVLSFAIYFFIFAAVSALGLVTGVGSGNAEFGVILSNFVSQAAQMAISGALVIGLFGFYLGIAQENEARLELLFVGFKRFWASLGTYLIYILIALFFSIFLCLLLGAVSYYTLGAVAPRGDYVWAFWPVLLGFWLGSIYPYLTYFMAFLCIADDEDCGVFEAFRRSKEMMKGNKWAFFCLHWRFFGWALIASFLTFGIGYLWLIPYFLTSFAKFYEDVK